MFTQASRLLTSLSTRRILGIKARFSTNPVFSHDIHRDYKKIIPTDGVRIDFLQAFIEDCGGREAIKDLTTRDVCNQVIIPATRSQNMSFCELIKSKHPSHPAIQPATIYVSHLWDYNFLSVIDTLSMMRPDHVVWMDVFALNHHRNTGSNSTSVQSLQALDAMIQHQIGSMAFIFSPDQNFQLLSRTWNLFEFYLAWKHQKSISFLSPDFLQTVEYAANNNILQHFLQLKDIESTSTTAPGDKSTLISYLKDIHNTNAQQPLISSQAPLTVSQQIQKSVIYSITNHIENLYEDTKQMMQPFQLHIINALTNLYQFQPDQFAKGVALSREWFEISSNIVGANHYYSIENLQNRAVLQINLKQYDEAEATYLEYIALAEKIYPKIRVDPSITGQLQIVSPTGPPQSVRTSEEKSSMLEKIVSAYYGLATLYEAKLEGPEIAQNSNRRRLLQLKVLSNMRLSYERCKLYFGDNTIFTYECLLNYIKILEKYGDQLLPTEQKYQEIERLLSVNLQKIILTAGMDHLVTISSLKSLALAYNQNKKHKEAEETLRSLLPIQRKLYQNVLQQQKDSATSSYIVDPVTGLRDPMSVYAENAKIHLLDTLYGLTTIYSELNVQNENAKQVMMEYLSLEPSNLADKLPIIYQLGLVHQKLKENDALERLFTSHLKDFMAFYGDNAREPYLVMTQLAMLHAEKRHWLKAYLYSTHCYDIHRNLGEAEKQFQLLYRHLEVILKSLTSLTPKDLVRKTAIVLPPKSQNSPEIPKSEDLTDEQCEEYRWEQIVFYLNEMYELLMKEKLYQQAYSIRREYVSVFWLRKKYEETEKAFNDCLQVLALFKAEKAENHTFVLRETAKVRAGLAMLAGEKGEVEQVEPRLHTIIQEITRQFGESDIDTIDLQNNLALHYFHRRLYDKAIPLMRKNLDLLLQHHPKSTTHSLSLIMSLVNFHTSLHQYKERDLLLTKCYTRYFQVLGKDNDFVKQLDQMIQSFKANRK